MLRATKVRTYPSPEQTEFLIAQFGAVRFSYNQALHIQSHMHRHYGVTLNPKKYLKPLLAVAKKSRKYHWLKQYDSIALQQSVRNLHMAFSNSFNPTLKARYAKFKSSTLSNHCVGVKVFEEAIKLPKIEPIQANIHRDINVALNIQHQGFLN